MRPETPFKERSHEAEVKQEHMTASQWALIPANPIQRDTERHAKKAMTAHLSKKAPSHARVSCAELPDRSRFKLDGHTRSYLWERELLDAPDQLIVDVYPVNDRQEAIDFYKHFDNPSAAENATDRLSGAYRINGITPSSRLLTHGGITSAFKLIYSKPSIYQAVRQWKNELEAIDSLDLTITRMPAPLVCAALLTIRNHGEKAERFWDLYNRDMGQRVEGRSDGVDELSRIIAEKKARRQVASGDRSLRLHLAGRALSCCENYIKGKSYSQWARATDVQTYKSKIMHHLHEV